MLNFKAMLASGVLVIIASMAAAQSDFAIQAESQASEDLLMKTREDILNGQFRIDQKDKSQPNIDVMLQAIDDLTFEADQNLKDSLLRAIAEIETLDLELAERLQAEAIRRSILGKDFATESSNKISADALKARYFFKALLQNLDKKSVLVLLSNEDVFTDPAWQSLIKWTKSKHTDWARLVAPTQFARPGLKATATGAVTADMIRDLFNFSPATESYASGRYHKKPRIYMFCRSVRKYPCVMIMRDAQGKVWKNSKGEVWSQPALAFSRHNKPFSKPSGDTPAGVQRIDSVMPSADQQMVFGKFRRLILNFVGGGNDEALTKLLIPPSSYASNWWQQASVARDIGRSALRIHGTGLRSSSSKTYYPMVPTSGCIAKRENKYGTTTYIDQRDLLDELMKASGLTATYNNETSIYALLYMIEIDAKKAPVTLADLKALNLF